MDLTDALKETVREVIREELAALSLARQPEGDRLLTVKEAAAVLKMSEDWVRRNAHRLPFTRRPADAVLRFSDQGMQKWLKTR